MRVVSSVCDVMMAGGVQCQVVIERSLSHAEQLITDVDLHLLMHDSYGKGFIKCCNISPDAYVQIALQLAYYRVRCLISVVSRSVVQLWCTSCVIVAEVTVLGC